jgi:hypothetical protein
MLLDSIDRLFSEPIDGVDGQNGLESGGNGSGADFLPLMGWIFTKPVKT